VTVVSSDSTPVTGATVTFAIQQGGGLLSVTTQSTDAAGQASTTYALGALQGVNIVTASVVGVPTGVSFSETGNLAAATHKDYYVSQQAEGASDSNDGLSATFTSTHGPWLTVGNAVSKAVAGDIVHVGPGNYPETLYDSVSGTTSAPIRFYASAIGANPVITSFRVKAASNVQIRGFTVVGSKVMPSNWADMPTVIVDDPSIVINASTPWSTREGQVDEKYATYTNLFSNVFNGPSYSLFTAGLWVTASTNVVVSDNTVSLHTIGIDIDNGSSNVTVFNNNCFHCRDGIWSTTSTSGASFTNSVIQSNYAYENLNCGITASSNAQGITIANNLCQYNAISGFVVSAGATSCLVQHNVSQYNGYYTETMESPGSSSYNFYDIGSGNVADGNWAAFQYDPTQNDGNGFINDTSSASVTFTNNVAIGCNSGISLTSSNGNTVINNTLVGNGSLTTSASNGAGVRLTSSTGNTIENNIFSGNRVGGLQSSGLLTQNTANYNLYDSSGIAIHDSYSSSATYATAAAAHTATGAEADGMSASPGFVSSTNFQLAAGSPAISKANPAVAPPIDYTGAARKLAPDIGAFESH